MSSILKNFNLCKNKIYSIRSVKKLQPTGQPLRAKTGAKLGQRVALY